MSRSKRVAPKSWSSVVVVKGLVVLVGGFEDIFWEMMLGELMDQPFFQSLVKLRSWRLEERYSECMGVELRVGRIGEERAIWRVTLSCLLGLY